MTQVWVCMVAVSPYPSSSSSEAGLDLAVSPVLVPAEPGSGRPCPSPLMDTVGWHSVF